jgi:hypothetical protein
LPTGYPIDSSGNPVDKDGVTRGSHWAIGAFEAE